MISEWRIAVDTATGATCGQTKASRAVNWPRKKRLAQRPAQPAYILRRNSFNVKTIEDLKTALTFSQPQHWIVPDHLQTHRWD